MAKIFKFVRICHLIMIQLSVTQDKIFTRIRLSVFTPSHSVTSDTTE